MMAEANEIPTLFNDSMVRALMDGAKVQTRRPWAPQPDKRPDGWWATKRSRGGTTTRVRDPREQAHAGPFGLAGDLLYVREPWTPADYLVGSELDTPCVIAYRADRSALNHARTPAVAIDTTHWPWDRMKWRPSIHLHKSNVRTWLRVERVWVERLQDITDADCIKEGVREVTKDGRLCKYCVYDRSDYSSVPWSEMPRTAREAFFHLWDGIYKSRGLGVAENPWVWCCEFTIKGDRE